MGVTAIARRIPPLNPLRAFEAAASHESFTKAGFELHVTQGAVSRQVKALEAYLGFDLFERTATGVELNQSGKIYAAALTQAFDAIAQATDELVAARSHTVLTIRGYTTFLMRWLIPRLPDFQIKHPNIEVRLIAAGDPVDFKRDNVDLGILYGNGRWKGLASDRLFCDELLPVCSPRLLRADGASPLCDPADLAHQTLLHLNRRRRDWPDWLADSGHGGLLSSHNYFFEDLGVVYQCAIAGMGVAMGQHAYVEDEIAAGRLIAPFGHILRRNEGYYLVCSQDRIEATKIAVFRDWLSTQIGESTAKFPSNLSLANPASSQDQPHNVTSQV